MAARELVVKAFARIILVLAVLGLVIGAIKFTPRSANAPAPVVASKTPLVTRAPDAVVSPCGSEAGADGVRHSRAFLYLLR